MKRGEVWWVRFEPAVGGEVRKQRPAVIVSKTRLQNLVGRLSKQDLTGVEHAIRVQLALPCLAE